MTTPLSERLAAAFIALKIATNRTDDPALLAAARAYSRIADEVDGVGAVEHRAANLEHLDIIGSRNMEIERLSASLATAERERDRLLAKLAELEDAATALRGGIIDHDRAWQAATGAATPADVRVLTPAILRGAMFSALPGDADGASDLFRALTAPGPVVLPGATPSDEEIAKEIHDALDGDYDAESIWSGLDDSHRKDMIDAVAKVRAKLTGTATVRRAQTSAGGDHAPAQVAQPAPGEPAKGARFVVMPRKDVPVGARYDGVTTADHAARVLAFVEKNPDVPARQWMTMTEEARAGFGAVYPLAVVDTARAPSDVERLAAATRSAKFPTLPTDAIGSTYLAEAILRHLAGPLPGVDRAEALIAAYVDAFAETSGTICDRWSDVDQKRKDHAIATMRRALIAVGAQEPARVTAPIIDEIVNAADEWAGDSDPDTSVYSRETTRLLRSVRVLRARRIGRTVAP